MSRACFRDSVCVLALISAGAAFAADGPMVAANTAPSSNIFNLGQVEHVTVSASAVSEAISESTVSSEETFKSNALPVDRAIDLTAGAASGPTGGPPNELLFFIRGLDRLE